MVERANDESYMRIMAGLEEGKICKYKEYPARLFKTLDLRFVELQELGTLDKVEGRLVQLDMQDIYDKQGNDTGRDVMLLWLENRKEKRIYDVILDGWGVEWGCLYHALKDKECYGGHTRVSIEAYKGDGRGFPRILVNGVHIGLPIF